MNPPPIPNDNPSIWDMVIQDMHGRAELGKQRYGTVLQVGNGRDALQDAYEEVLDQAAYMRQEIEAKRLLLEEVERLRRENAELRLTLTDAGMLIRKFFLRKMPDGSDKARVEDWLRRKGLQGSILRLAAFEDERLSDEGARYLDALSRDESRPTHAGRDLPEADLVAVPKETEGVT